MKTRKMRLAVLPAAVLMTMTLLAGCSGGDDEKPKDGSASPTPTVAAPSDKDLGAALDKLVYHGTSQTSADGGACLISAVQEGGVSAEGQNTIVETGGDDIAALADSMMETNAADASILVSAELASDFATCVDAQAAPSVSDGGDDKEPAEKGPTKKEPGDTGDKTYESPKAPADDSGKEAASKANKPNLTPKYPLDDDVKINSAAELKDGLVSMFSSYAKDDAQKKTYAAAGDCLANAVFENGFSDEALIFLAEGAPIGVGSVSDYLPTDEDKVLWNSPDFTTALVGCTSNVTTGEGQDGEA